MEISTLHVTANFQHEVCIKIGKWNHVATVLVAGPALQVGSALALRLYCAYQCIEASNAHSHSILILQKQTSNFHSKQPGLNQFFQMKLRNTS